MSYRWLSVAAFSLLLLTVAGTVQADIMVIQFDPLLIALQGQVSSSAGTFSHPSLQKSLQIAKSSTVNFYKSTSMSSMYGQQLSRAGTNGDDMFKAALWTAKKGMPKEISRGLDATIKVDANHAGAKKLLELKKQIEGPLPDEDQVEKELRAVVSHGGMKVSKSAHFLLLHDAVDKPDIGERKPGPARRLDLLEQSYLSFVYLFLGCDAPLELPQRRMKVVMVDSPQDYRELAVAAGPDFASRKGFYNASRDVLVLQGKPTTMVFGAIDPMYKKAKSDFDEAKKTRAATLNQAQRWLATMEGIMQLDRESAEESQVTRESVPLFMADLGLFPKGTRVPDWIETGLSIYMEAPEEMSFAGGASVSPSRLANFKAFAPDRQRSNIDFIVGDQILDYTQEQKLPEAGRIQAWGLMHFLMEQRPRETVTFFKNIGAAAPDTPLSSDFLLDCFRDAFGVPDSTRDLDREWHGYMDTLRTDIETLTLDSSR